MKLIENVVLAATIDIPSSATMDPHSIPTVRVGSSSWIFRSAFFIYRQLRHLFGIASVIFLLAVAANIPLIQFLSFGFLLEVMGRLARQRPLSDSMVGLKKAAVMGGFVLGTWLSLLPLRLVSSLWFEAHLIDPTSVPSRFLRGLQIVLMAMVILHIAAAWLCGGKLRYFLWPLVAPVSLGVWCLRRAIGWKYFQRPLVFLTQWFAPGLATDIANTPPIVDWFLPAIFVRKLFQKQVYASARDRVWDFFVGLRLNYYFWMGLKGFIGSFLWLVVPTILLAGATFAEGPAAAVAGALGVLIATPIFALLPFLQAHFAIDGRLSRFLELGTVWKNFGRAPFAHMTALTLVLLLALPLFFLKIETIPAELLWTLSIVFLIFTLPAKWITGWAYRRGLKRDRVHRWWLRYPIAVSMIPVAFSFAIILTLTRYVSWNGAFSLFENHVFLLPAPFWQL